MNWEHMIPHEKWKRKLLLFYEDDTGWNTHERDWDAVEIPQRTWEMLDANMHYRISQEAEKLMTGPPVKPPSFNGKPIFDPVAWAKIT